MPIQDIKLKDIAPGENYRKHTDKNGMKELTSSVKSHGVLQPIIVRKVKKGYEVVCGHRRRAAAIAAGLKTIPASVLNVDDAMALEIAVIENSQREDPNPMDEALGFKQLLDMGKHTHDTLAKKLGKSLSYVYTRLKLNDLPKDCQKALLDGSIEFGHAQALCRLADKKDMSALLRDILDHDMSPAKVRGYVNAEYGQWLANAVFDTQVCDKCQNNTVTQSRLFPGVDADERCMNEKCYREKSMAVLKAMAESHAANGWEVVSGLEELRKLDRKGVRMEGRKPLKKDCALCKERAFFYADDEGRIPWGWWCPSKACNDEVYYGIKPRAKKDSPQKGTEGTKGPEGPDVAPPSMGGVGEGEGQPDSALGSDSFEMIVVDIEKEGDLTMRGLKLAPSAGCDPAVLDLELGQKVRVSINPKG